MAHTRFRIVGPLRFVAALSCGLCAATLFGCSSDDAGADTPRESDTPASEPPSNTGEPPADDPALVGTEGATEISISSDGDVALSSGTARLTFVENSDFATLNIIATSASADSMYLTLKYPRDAAMYGHHITALALPGESENVAHVLRGDAPENYRYSRSGEVDLTLSREGHQISGTFDIAVSDVNDLGPREFEPVGDVTPLTGSFTGNFDVYCYAVLPGHSMAVRPDNESEFCESLGL